MILVCRDAMGNALTVGGAAVSASIELSTSDKILQADVTDHGDGTYAVATTIAEAGTHRVVARVGGFQPEALPLIIVPGAPHGPSCRIATPKRWPVAGEPSTLELTACDAHGNEVEQGGTRWGGLLDAPAPPDGGDPWRRLEGALAVSDLGGGKYTIHIESATAGAHKLTIWPEWLFGGGEPSSLVVPVQVVPGATQPAGFLVEGRGLLHAAAGTPAAFVVRPRSFGEGIQGSRDAGSSRPRHASLLGRAARRHDLCLRHVGAAARRRRQRGRRRAAAAREHGGGASGGGGASRRGVRSAPSGGVTLLRSRARSRRVVVRVHGAQGVRRRADARRG